MQRVEGDDLAALRAFLPVRDELPVFHERLPFYEHGTLLRFGDEFVIATGPGPFGMGGHHYLLNGAAEAILQANKTAGLVLTSETASAYLRFFSRFLSRGGLQFEIIETLDGYTVIEGALPDDLRMSGGPDGQGGFLYRAMMRFGDRVHEVQLATTVAGAVRMLGDVELARLARLS